MFLDNLETRKEGIQESREAGSQENKQWRKKIGPKEVGKLSNRNVDTKKNFLPHF